MGFSEFSDVCRDEGFVLMSVEVIGMLAVESTYRTVTESPVTDTSGRRVPRWSVTVPDGFP